MFRASSTSFEHRHLHCQVLGHPLPLGLVALVGQVAEGGLPPVEGDTDPVGFQLPLHPPQNIQKPKMAWVGKPSLVVQGCIPKKARFTMEFPSITSSFIPSHPLPRGPCPAQSVSRSAYEDIVPTFSRKSNENPPLAGPAPGIKRQGRQPPATSRKFSQILPSPNFSCYNTPGKQKCGSLWVVAHPQACAGEHPPTQRPFGRTAWGIIRYFCFPRKGGSRIVATYSLAFVCKELASCAV